MNNKNCKNKPIYKAWSVRFDPKVFKDFKEIHCQKNKSSAVKSQKRKVWFNPKKRYIDKLIIMCSKIT